MSEVASTLGKWVSEYVSTVTCVTNTQMDQNPDVGFDLGSRDWSSVDLSSVLLSTSREGRGCGEWV